MKLFRLAVTFSVEKFLIYNEQINSVTEIFFLIDFYRSYYNDL